MLCDFSWLFKFVQGSLTFPWLENAFLFSRFSSFSSPSGHPALEARTHILDPLLKPSTLRYLSKYLEKLPSKPDKLFT